MNTAATEKETPSVISTFEMAGIVVLFVSLLILFFPKDKIEQMVTQESSNYNLSIQYLTNIIHSYPEDTNAKLMLVQIYVKTGRFEEATQLLERMPEGDTYKKKLHSLQYDIAKARYFSSTNSQEERLSLSMIERLLEKMVLAATSKNEWLFILTEAKSMNLGELRVRVETMMIKKNFLSQAEAIESFHRARYLHMEDEALQILTLGMNNENDSEWLKVAGDYYVSTKRYGNAVPIYKELLRHGLAKGEQKKIFEKLLHVYRVEKEDESAIKLIREYEGLIIQDEDLAQKVISFYLGNGHLELAKELSLKIYTTRYPSGE